MGAQRSLSVAVWSGDPAPNLEKMKGFRKSGGLNRGAQNGPLMTHCTGVQYVTWTTEPTTLWETRLTGSQCLAEGGSGPSEGAHRPSFVLCHSGEVWAVCSLDAACPTQTLFVGPGVGVRGCKAEK